jgi:hypothetical protein
VNALSQIHAALVAGGLVVDTQRTIGDGLFALDAERRFVVIDGYDDGAEFVAEVREWAGTHIEAAFAERLAKGRGPVQLHQEVRLRVLRAL